MKKRVSVLGLGYIGLPTAIVAAKAGYEVYGFDIDKVKVRAINEGDPTILEPEVQQRLAAELARGSFKAYTELQYAQIFLIAVPTPFLPNKQADLSFVLHATEMIARRLMPGNLVILESTVPVGATQQVTRVLQDISGLEPGKDFFVAYCPERVLPGKIFHEVVHNERMIGGIEERSAQLAAEFYALFVKGALHQTDDKTAEMVKLVENSSRDVQIAFANQVEGMCRQAGIDPYQVIELANRHPRVAILNPTCGVGGHCIAVDPWFLIESFPEQSQLLRTARFVNDSKPYVVLQRVQEKVQTLRMLGKQVANVLALGLTFKPDVDDTRESPALKIAQHLAKQSDITLQVYDPFVAQHADWGLTFAADLATGIAWADLVVILVKHRPFMDISGLSLDGKMLVDTCGLLRELGSPVKHSGVSTSAVAPAEQPV